MQISLPPTELAERVLQILSDGRARTPREIHRPNGLIPTPTSTALRILVRAGRVLRDGEPGFYRYRIHQ
jgi:hypothetical protein